MIHTTTLLDFPADQGLRMIRARAAERALPFEENADGLVLNLPWGQVLALREKTGLRLTLRASDRTRLHLLQEAVDRRLDEAQVAADRRWSLTEPGSRPPNLTFAVVDACERAYPSYYRVRLSGRSLDRFSRDGLHFRLLFPPADRPDEWPAMQESGRVRWPGGIGAWHRPVYTTRSFDPTDGTLEFDVFAHPGGRVTGWCETLRPGARIALMGPGGEWLPRARWLALFGDETALPAIARILRSLPEDCRGAATICVSDAKDMQHLPKPDGMSVRWLLRGGPVTLLDALDDLDMPPGDRFVWFASERSEAAAARSLLLARGLGKAEMRTASYWAR